MSSSLYKTRSFSWLLNRFIKTDMQTERQDLVNAIVTLQKYGTTTLSWNNRKLRTFKKLAYENQDQAKSIGYLDHIKKVEDAIKDQSVIADRIASFSIKNNQVNDLELRAGLYQSNSKSIEALTHFARDWTKLGEPELKPLMEYIKTNIDKNIPTAKERSKTLVVVPGSGLGRVAHEVATFEPKFKSVQSVEFSSLMYLCNQFVYSDDSHKESFNIYPYLHTYSHHVNVKNQVRSTVFNRELTKPKNLTINIADLRKFTVEDVSDYDNVLIVTAFFIDTAQNLFDYFKAFERIIGDKKGLWINIGPLKYGTAPLVEFSLEELRELRRLRGWKDLDEPKPYGSESSGYLTDTEGLWQGYYGLGRWTSSFNN